MPTMPKLIHGGVLLQPVVSCGQKLQVAGQGGGVAANVDDAIRVLEAALGHSAEERHLAAFEAELLLVALAGVLALLAAAAGLAHARAAAAAHALGALPRAGGVGEG